MLLTEGFFYCRTVARPFAAAAAASMDRTHTSAGGDSRADTDGMAGDLFLSLFFVFYRST